MSTPYRHSVWIDVFGVVLFGAVLLGGAGYLLYHTGGAAGGIGNGGPIVSGGRHAGPPRPGPGLSARRPAPPSRSTPLFGSGRAPAQNGSDVEAPFSEDWQEQATPDLTGPSSSPSAPSGGGAPVGTAPEPSGPAIASRGPSGGGGSQTARTGRKNAGTDWTAEARRVAGRARALSNQLGQMAQPGSEGEAESSREDAPATTSAGRTSSSASSDPGTPGDPSQVPIDDHVYWLAVAGLLFGVWRLS